MSSSERYPVAGWRLPTDLVEKIQRLAEVNRRSPTQEARVALEQYVERHAGPVPTPQSQKA